MPHHPEDKRHAHLPLVREDPNPRRRAPTFVPPPPPPRGGREAFGGQLRTRVRALEAQAQALPPKPLGVDPRLVFRVPLSPRANILGVIGVLEKAGIDVLGTEPDNAIIAFRNDLSLAALRNALDAYLAGPQAGINPTTERPYASTVWDVLEWVEVDQMALWSRSDRIGPRLAGEIGGTGAAIDPARTFVLDLELWHQGTRALALQTIAELRKMIATRDAAGRLLDEFVGDLVCLAKVSVPAAVLGQLLDWEMVAEAELPPTPVIDLSAVNREVPTNFPTPARPAAGGPRVCVLDSGVALNHPLLANHIGHAAAVLTAQTTPADESGHGTLVGGIAVFGDVRAARAVGRFQSDVLLFSGRVLNADNGFDDEQLIVTQMGRAIEMFVAEPYACRVFNLSLGANEPWLLNNRRQSMWAESLDLLARRHKVLIVVSAGNQELGLADTQADAEAVVTNYPRYLFEPECGLNEPATAAIAVTVGGLAVHTEPAVRKGVNASNVHRAVAGACEPTPTTRVGPGLARSMKPDFVAHGGNCLVDGFAMRHVIREEPDAGLGVMSFSHEPTAQLFNFGVGTSLAAPQVSRIAALTWYQLRQDLGADPHPNLVRAVLATAAVVPELLLERFRICVPDGCDVSHVCGYGVIDEDLALDTGDRRLTLLKQDKIPVNSFLLYAVPMTDAFRKASGKKRIVIGLAFDPPVRRRRQKYLGVRMKAMLIRGKTPDEIADAYRNWTLDERETLEQEEADVPAALKGRFVCDLQPSTKSLVSGTLHRQEWEFSSEKYDYGDTYYVLVRCDRNWAPDEHTEQDFGLAVSLVTSDGIQLYTQVRERIEQRVELRQRSRERLPS